MLPVVMTRQSPDMLPTLSVQIDPRRWLWLPMPDLPIPQGVPLAFAGWMLLLVLGAIGIAVVVAGKLIRPLALLEGTIARIGPDGVLPELPETGPAEMRATARTLNRLSTRLRAAIESRMRLVAAAGHDLRTPMTRMRLRAEFLPDDERGAWLKDLDELDRIADSAIRLVREEVEGGDVEPLRLDRLVETVSTELAEQGLPVTLLRAVPASVKVGPLALKRALRNLVINAATHGQGPRWRWTWPRTRARAKPASPSPTAAPVSRRSCWPRCSSRSSGSTRRGARRCRAPAWASPSPRRSSIAAAAASRSPTGPGAGWSRS